MRLTEVTINNFCSCDGLIVPLSGFNPIVGYNNAGKSNILRSINWLLKKSALPNHMFFDPSKPITVEGIIENINLNLLPKNQQIPVSKYLRNGALKFRRRQDQPNISTTHIKIDVFDYNTMQWIDNPVGLDTAISVLFPEPLYIEAMEDAGEDVGKFGAKNTIGLLLKQVLKLISEKNTSAIKAVETALSNASSHLNGKKRMPEISLFEADATQAISSFFPGISLHLSFATPNLEELFKSSIISLSETQGQPRPFSSYGHGAQRSAHMALIKLLASLTTSTKPNQGAIVVLLIDEPELYLHPQAIELLQESLVQLSNNNFQIVFSTHSPLLIGRSHALETLMVYKDSKGKTQARKKIESAAQTLSKHSHHSEAIFSIQSANHLLFSEKVLLVEGKTEEMILPHLFKVAMNKTLASDKGCIVSGSSSSALTPMMNILKSVGFTPKALADLDYIFKVAPFFNQINKTDPNYLKCLKWFKDNSAAHKFHLDASGLPTKKGPCGNMSSISVVEAFELMAINMPKAVKALVQVLRNQNIWIWSKGAIEAHLGIGKTDTDRINFINLAINNGNLNHATDSKEVIKLLKWI